MVERVSRALCFRHEYGGFGGEVTADIARYIEATVSRDWPKWSEEARFAIAAMREPTPEMRHAGALVLSGGSREVWGSMIDVALWEKLDV
jgi:hypothetical protein